VLESNLPPTFLLTNPPNRVVIVPEILTVSNAATDIDLPVNALGYTLVTTVTGTNLPNIDTNGLITWSPTLEQAGSNYLFTTIVTDTNPWAVNAQSLSATNSFNVTVLAPLPPGQPQTNVVDPHSIRWFGVNVPTNADFATNQLIYASAPVNLWFSTNRPPSFTNATDAELLPNATTGFAVIRTNIAPFLVPGGRYFLGVQNDNSVPVTNLVEVDFHLAIVKPVFAIASIVQTNFAGTNGYLISWQAPAGDQFHLQWSTALLPANWNYFNGVISESSQLGATNGRFQYFDDGSQTGGFSATRFYRLLLLDSPTNTAPFFRDAFPADRFVSVSTTLAFTNPAADWDVPVQALIYTVTNSSGFTNVTINPANGAILWTPTLDQLGTTNIITTIITDSGVPPKSATNRFTVFVSAAPAFSFSGIAVQSNGLRLQWSAPTNDQFQVQWTTNLAAPISWTPFVDIITSTNGLFNFVDTNGTLLLKFYQLILLP